MPRELVRQKLLLYSDSEAILVPLCLALSQTSLWDLVIVSPHPQKLSAWLEKSQKQSPNQSIQLLKPLKNRLDWPDILGSVQPHILIMLSPIPDKSFKKLATLCVDLKIHCLDTSDAPERLSLVDDLQTKAKENAISVITGVSQVPGLSSVVIDNYAPAFGTLREVYCGISVSQLSKNQFTDPVSLAEGLGEPFQRLEGGVWKTVYGWQNQHRFYYGDNIGYRWHGNRNVPDLKLIPMRYPTIKSMVFHTGVDNPYIQWTLWHASWLRRIKMVPSLGWLSRILGWLERKLRRKKPHRHGMMIHLLGANKDYQPLEIKWHLVAEEEAQDELSAIICQCVLENLRHGKIPPGVQSCIGLFTLSQFDERLNTRIYHTVEETTM